jgi:LPS export ABC transporter protein LptC
VPWKKESVKKILTQRFRPFILTGVVLLIVGKIVFLSPASLEESQSPPKTVDMQSLVDPETEILAPGIPKDKIADYSIDHFTYVSTHEGAKEWNLIADRAYLFNSVKIVHSKHVKALLYDADGQITVVTGKESKYRLDQRDLEVYGNVETTLPDGFVLKSEYMRFKPKEKFVEIPTHYPVSGNGKEEGGDDIHFTSLGFNYDMKSQEIFLPSTVHMNVIQSNDNKEPTTLISDQCMIYRKKQIAYYSMRADRSDATRFVEIIQPSTWGRGRTADLNYGSSPTPIQFLTLHDDVSIKDLKKDPTMRQGAMKYATGGRADFDSQKNIVVLTNYPQVYEDEDTVTGDKITLHRDTDIIEVEHSNAFRQGS